MRRDCGPEAPRDVFMTSKYWHKVARKRTFVYGLETLKSNVISFWAGSEMRTIVGFRAAKRILLCGIMQNFNKYFKQCNTCIFNKLYLTPPISLCKFIIKIDETYIKEG